jgi:hypothetical protein
MFVLLVLALLSFARLILVRPGAVIGFPELALS